MTLICSCDTLGTCPSCRPPCEWPESEDGKVTCGEPFATRIAGVPVCLTHWEYSMIHWAVEA